MPTEYSLYGQRISETYPRVLQITSGDTVLDGSGDTRSLFVGGNFTANTIFIGSSDISGLFAPIGATGSTIYVQPGTNINTGGTSLLPTVNVVPSPSFNNLSVSGNITSPYLVNYVQTEIGQAIRDQGPWNASTGLFPFSGGSGAGGAIENKNQFTITTSGTIAGSALTAPYSIVRAIVDNPGQTASNWFMEDRTTPSFPPLFSVDKHNFIFIETNGDDSTAAIGDAGRPCGTLAGAHALLDTLPLSGVPSLTNIYTIEFGSGEFEVIAPMLVRPFVYYVGQTQNHNSVVGSGTFSFSRTKLNVTQPDGSRDGTEEINLDPLWTGNTGGNYLGAIYNMQITQPKVKFDFATASIWGATYLFKTTRILFDATFWMNDPGASGVIVEDAHFNYEVNIRGGSLQFKNSTTDRINLYNDNAQGGTDVVVDVDSSLLTQAINCNQTDPYFITINYKNFFGEIVSQTFDTAANVIVTSSSPLFGIQTANSALENIITEANSFDSWFPNTTPNTEQLVFNQLAYGIGTTTFGSFSAPVFVGTDGFTTDGTNISTTAVNQVIYCAGIAPNALTTITDNPAILPYGDGSTLYTTANIYFIGTTLTRALLIPYQAGVLEINGDCILNQYDMLHVRWNGQAWQEVSRTSGLPKTYRQIQADMVDGVFAPQNLIRGAFGEEGVTLWTASSGTKGSNTTAANIGRGNRSISWDASATNQNFTTPDMPIPAGLYGRKGLASIIYKGGSSLLNWGVYSGTTLVAGTTTQTLGIAANFTYAAIPFTFPTSGNIRIRINSTGNAPIAYFDEATIRPLFEIDAPLLGYTSGAGTITSADTIISAIQKLNGNATGGTQVQPGSNISTGGTATVPIINIVDSPSFNNITLSGTGRAVNFSATTLSGATIYSGSTDIDSIFHRKNGYLLQKAGLVSGNTFSGSPLKCTVIFNTAFAANNYAITVSGEPGRILTIESRAPSGFTINSNSSTAFTESVFWNAIQIGEGYS